jgi:ABC-2 type transport system ATP-binding protein
MNNANVVSFDRIAEDPIMYGTPLITLHNLTVRRGAFTLEIPEWRVEPGKVIGLVGPNGAGKTTLLECLAGLRKPNGGSTTVFDRDPWTQPVQVRSSLGFMSDDMPVFDMRIGPLLRTLSGYYQTWDAQLVDELLERFKLDPKKKASELSKGQGTRLRLVTAMAFRPKVLLLDEPASGLDLAGRHSLLKSVLDVVYDPTRSVVISSHMLRDVERVSDRLLVLNEGRVVKEGPTESLVGDHRTLEEALEEWGAAG